MVGDRDLRWRDERGSPPCVVRRPTPRAAYCKPRAKAARRFGVTAMPWRNVACSSWMRAELDHIAIALGVEIDGAAHDRLARLGGLWRTQGRAINLTGASSDAALAEHIADGLAVVACAGASPNGRPLQWLDVGSGGGFPALVVAAVSNAAITLVEPRLKRAAFLEFALATIGNKSTVVRARVGDATWDRYTAEREQKLNEWRFDVATSRAVFAPDAWIALGDKLVVGGGLVLAHVRPGHPPVAGRQVHHAVEHGRSRIEAYLREIGPD